MEDTPTGGVVRRPAPHGGHISWRCGQKTCSSRRTQLLEVWSEDLLLKENTATVGMVRRPAPHREHIYWRYGQKACSLMEDTPTGGPCGPGAEHLLSVPSEGLLLINRSTVGTIRSPAPRGEHIYCRYHHKACSSRRTQLLQVPPQGLLLKENTSTAGTITRPAPQGEHIYCRYHHKACSSRRTQLLQGVGTIRRTLISCSRYNQVDREHNIYFRSRWTCSS